MRIIFLSLCLLFANSVLAAAPCEICNDANGVTDLWKTANSKERRLNASEQSHKVLTKLAEKTKGVPKPNVILALVRLLGAIYAVDYDPLNDELSLFRNDLQRHEFRTLFDQEMVKLPDLQRRKLMEGLQSLEHRPKSENDNEE